MVNHLFTTPVFHQRLEPPAGALPEIAAHLLAERGKSSGLQRSNRGGWHSDGNLFAPEQRDFPWLRETIVRSVLDYAGAGLGFTGELNFQLTGWAVINGADDYNVPHNHSPHLLSGALYVQVPEGMTGGEIVFLDPRFNLNANVSQAMKDLGHVPPWNRTTVSHPPVTGDLLIFPSWLVHYVNSYTAPDPEAVRIVISFNASV